MFRKHTLSFEDMLSGCVMKIGYFHLFSLPETKCMASEEGVLRGSVCSVQARQGKGFLAVSVLCENRVGY